MIPLNLEYLHGRRKGSCIPSVCLLCQDNAGDNISAFLLLHMEYILWLWGNYSFWTIQSQLFKNEYIYLDSQDFSPHPCTNKYYAVSLR